MAGRSWAEILSGGSPPRARIPGRQFIRSALIATAVFLGVTASASAVPLSPDQKDGIMTRCLIAGGPPKVCCAAADDSLSPNSCIEKGDAVPATETKPATVQQTSKPKTGALDFSKIQEGPTRAEPPK